MSEVKVPFSTGGEYGVITLEHPNLEEESLLAALRSEVDFDSLARDVQRREEYFGEP